MAFALLVDVLRYPGVKADTVHDISRGAERPSGAAAT